MPSVTYHIVIESAPPRLPDDGMRWSAKLSKSEEGFATSYPAHGYGETAAQAAMEVVAAYVSDPS